MDKKIYVSLLIVSLLLNLLIGWKADEWLTALTEKTEEVEMYERYATESENLLYELDEHYDWVDSFDPSGYYEIVDAIECMKSKGN